MSERVETIKKLVEEILNSERNFKVSELLRAAARIARLQGDYSNLAWIEREFISPDAQLAKSDLGVELLNYLPDLEVFKPTWDKHTERILEERRVPVRDKNENTTKENAVLALTVPDIEQTLDGIILEREINKTIPANTMPGHIDTYFRQFTQNRVTLTLEINNRQSILDRIRHRTLKYLNQIEALLAYEAVNADVFESARRSVESELSAIAPDVLTKFNAAQERLSDGSPEAYSHALETCRRVLKTFADSVYPSTDKTVIGKDNKPRKLDDAHYVARLWQYLYELTGSHASPDVTLAVLDQLGNRIDKVYGLTNKGVHDEVVDYEAKQCVIQTFLTISDILAFRKASIQRNKNV